MSDSPRVSVVMPLFNKEKEIARALDSALAQYMPDFELIVVDDGSTDSGPEIARGYSDPRIRIVSQANAGVSAARNRGIESTRAGLIAFLDADDEWHPKFLATILDLTSKFPECSVFATGYFIANSKTGIRRAVLRGLPPDFQEGELQKYFEVASQSDPPLWSSAIAVRGAAIRAIGGFPPGVATGEDLLTWAKLAVEYKIAYSIAPLATFWEPEEIQSRPGRVPAVPDCVGAELAQLLDRRGTAAAAGLTDYVAHWHRMRGVIFLRLGDSRSARAELGKAIHLSGMRGKLLALFLISLLPGPSARIFYEAMKRMLTVRALDARPMALRGGGVPVSDVESPIPAEPRRAIPECHIAVIWQRFLPYHVARIRRLCERCAALGVRLTAIEAASQDASYGFDAIAQESGFDHVCCFPGSSYHDHRASEIHAKVLAALDRAQPDVVFAPATPFPEGMAAVAYRRRSGARSIMMDDAWEHTDHRGAIVTGVKRLVHANIDGVFIPAPSHAAYYRKLGFRDDQIVFGVDVVDNDRFAEGAARARAEAAPIKVAAAMLDNYFLYVGRFVPRKGLETLLAAYASYRARAPGKPCDLVLVGGGNHLETIWRMAAGIEGVHFAGAQFGDDLCRYYGRAKVLVVPSVSDPWALVVNEGLASGLPVIVSSGCGCARTLVSEGENGWCFPPEDATALTKLLLRAGTSTPETLAQMGRKSREIIGAWSLDRFADGVMQAMKLPRAMPASFLSDLAIRLWKGRVSVN